ncbi:Uncharacterised protein [Mycobacteroides abscessus]|nr:Uncharacterised protein [Mycobacteroides abscessus]
MPSAPYVVPTTSTASSAPSTPVTPRSSVDVPACVVHRTSPAVSRARTTTSLSPRLPPSPSAPRVCPTATTDPSERATRPLTWSFSLVATARSHSCSPSAP